MVASQTGRLDADMITEKVLHARVVARVLTRIGWAVLAIGLIGVAVTAALWISGEISLEQALATLLGTALASILSGATAYGSGVNVGLGAERLDLALRAAEPATRPDEV